MLFTILEYTKNIVIVISEKEKDMALNIISFLRSPKNELWGLPELTFRGDKIKVGQLAGNQTCQRDGNRYLCSGSS